MAGLDAAVFGDDDRLDLLDRFVEVSLAVDHAIIVPLLLLQFISGICQSAGAILLGLAPAGIQPSAKLINGLRGQEDKDGLGHFLSHGGRALDINFEQHILPGSQPFTYWSARDAIPVAMNLSMFKQLI